MHFQQKKTIQKYKKNKDIVELDDSTSVDCSCQYLLDNSLSNVGDSDCSCSECLQANLNAFNQFKQEFVTQKIQKRTLSSQRNKYQTKFQHNEKTVAKGLNRNSSLNNVRNNKDGYKNINHTNNSKHAQIAQSYYTQNRNDQINPNDYNLKDFIMLTKARTRDYLKKRSEMKKQQKLQKEKLKQKIKQNLQILKYTAKVILQSDEDKNKNQNNENKQEKEPHKYKWNHFPFSQKHKKSQKCCHQIPQKPKLNTNLQNINPEFKYHRDQILSNVKNQRISKQLSNLCCNCPNHHNKKQKQQIKKIQQFIQAQALKYQRKLAQQKMIKQQQEKIKNAKLRAIDIKCKQIVTKSKKYDPTISRTSFRLSADHFSTFSELRQNQIQRKEQKKRKQEVRKMMKEKNNKLQMKIYQDLDEDLNQHQDKSQTNLRKEQLVQEGVPWCEKIVKDAKIYIPKELKKQDKAIKNKRQKEKTAKVKNDQKTQKKLLKQKQQQLRKQEEKRKQIEMQMMRKKKQLMNEYKKRNQIVKNQVLRKQYSDSIKR